MIYLLLLMTPRFANDVILIQVLQKNSPVKIVIFIVIVRCTCYISNGRRYTKSVLRILLLSTFSVSSVN